MLPSLQLPMLLIKWHFTINATKWDIVHIRHAHSAKHLWHLVTKTIKLGLTATFQLNLFFSSPSTCSRVFYGTNFLLVTRPTVSCDEQVFAIHVLLMLTVTFPSCSSIICISVFIFHMNLLVRTCLTY